MSNRPEQDAVLEDLQDTFAPLMDPNEDPNADFLGDNQD
jgi:hypothetical protein